MIGKNESNIYQYERKTAEHCEKLRQPLENAQRMLQNSMKCSKAHPIYSVQYNLRKNGAKILRKSKFRRTHTKIKGKSAKKKTMKTTSRLKNQNRKIKKKDCIHSQRSAMGVIGFMSVARSLLVFYCHSHMSSDQNRSYLLYIRDYTSYSYVGIIISHYKDPY